MSSVTDSLTSFPAISSVRMLDGAVLVRGTKSWNMDVESRLVPSRMIDICLFSSSVLRCCLLLMLL